MAKECRYVATEPELMKICERSALACPRLRKGTGEVDPADFFCGGGSGCDCDEDGGSMPAATAAPPS